MPLPGKLTKHQLKGVAKALSKQRDYLGEKARKKKKRAEKAALLKTDKHKSKQQDITELVDEELKTDDLELLD